MKVCKDVLSPDLFSTSVFCSIRMYVFRNLEHRVLAECLLCELHTSTYVHTYIRNDDYCELMHLSVTMVFPLSGILVSGREWMVSGVCTMTSSTVTFLQND